MATVYSPQGFTAQGVSIDNNRRLFAFGERVAELAPEKAKFFAYLSRMRKMPTDDPVFKSMEQRHQYQRRYVTLKGAKTSTAHTSGTEIANYCKVDTTIDKFGKTVTTPVRPEMLLNGQILVMADTNGNPRHFKITQDPDLTADTSTAAEIDLTPLFTATCAFADNATILIVGTQFGEGTGAPDGWKDELFDREGYTQIFKTAIPLFSGTTMATRYRGRPNEFRRVWGEKLEEHAQDIENAVLFGVGSADEAGSPPSRRTWGIVSYAANYGKTYNFDYATSTYDDWIDMMSDFFHVESANSSRTKLVMAPLNVINWLNKIGETGFLKNTVGNTQYRLDIQNVKGTFGHVVTRIDTLHGSMLFEYNPLLRGPYEDWCVVVDLANVAYRPLSANGISRDTFIKTNVQDNDTDGRKDMITTEAGLEVLLPETHAILKFS